MDEITAFEFFSQLRMDVTRTWIRAAHDVIYRDKLNSNRVLRTKAKSFSDALNEEIAGDNMR